MKRLGPLALVALLACGQESPPSRSPADSPSPSVPPEVRPAPLLVLGIDGATRTIMDPLMDAGRLPNFQRLRERGFYVALGTRDPTISPIIWTSIATGKSEAKHGIHGFTAELPGTERGSRLELPPARERLALRLTALLPPELETQRVTLSAGGKPLGEMTLGREPVTAEHVLEAPLPGAHLELAFDASALKGKSHVYTTGLWRVEVSADGGKSVPLGPEHGRGHVSPAMREQGGKKWMETGGTREIATVSSNMRRVKALWNILSERGRRVLVAGYWVTWPAEKVQGTIISSYTSARYGQSKKGTFLQDFPHQTWPEALAAELAPVLEESILLGRRRAEQAAARFGATIKPRPVESLQKRAGFVSSTPVVPKVKDPGEEAEAMIWIAASDAFYGLAAEKLLREDVPDMTIVYQGEVDVVSHEWHDLEKSLTEGVIAEAYERADATLGRLLAAMGESAARANVVVLSDHGFAYDDKGVFEHQFTHPPGVLLMAGPGIAKGAVPEEPGVLDVPPTLLALMGLPAARDMDGRTMTEILAAPAPDPIETYETGGPKAPELPIVSPIDEAVKEQLTKLGYLQP